MGIDIPFECVLSVHNCNIHLEKKIVRMLTKRTFLFQLRITHEYHCRKHNLERYDPIHCTGNIVVLNERNSLTMLLYRRDCPAVVHRWSDFHKQRNSAMSPDNRERDGQDDYIYNRSSSLERSEEKIEMKMRAKEEEILWFRTLYNIYIKQKRKKKNLQKSFEFERAKWRIQRSIASISAHFH